MNAARKKNRLSESDIAFLCEHFHDTPNAELAEALGVSVNTIRARRTKLGLRKDAEFISEVNRKKAIKNHNADRINSREAREKRVETQKRLYESERIRLKWGLEQKSRYHLRAEPAEKLRQRYRLKSRGYIIDEANLIAYWTAETRRSPRLEAIPRGKKVGSIKPYYEFKPYEEE